MSMSQPKLVLPSNWKCQGNDYRKLPKEILADGTSVFTNLPCFSNAVSLLQKQSETSCVRIPLMQNIEAVSLGANPQEINGCYQIREFRYNKLDELPIKKGSLYHSAEIQTLLSYIKEHSDTQQIMLDIEGPFTILGGLIRSEKLFMAKRKQPELLKQLLFFLAEELAAYAKEAIQLGVKVISLSDPQSGIDLVGEPFYREFNGLALIHFMELVSNSLSHALIHICGKTSYGLLKTNMVRADAYSIPAQPYVDTLFSLADNPEITFVGHACIHIQNQNVNHIWKLSLN